MKPEPAPFLPTRCPILYDQGGLLIVDKPEGVLSHPNPIKGQKQGQTRTRAAFEGEYDFERRVFLTAQGKIWLIHRLDQDTSGVLVAARSEEAAEKCRALFEEGKIRKVYLALSAGRIVPAKGQWNDALQVRREAGRVRSRVASAGPVNAKLSYKVKTFFPRYGLSLLELELHTGRTHQIRVQSAYRRHELIGDEIYGNFPLNKKIRRETGLNRLFLHASFIEFRHPITGEGLHVEAPLPLKLAGVVDFLSR